MLVLLFLSDIYGVIAKSQVTLLTLFDVSAAFDTIIDYEIPLQRPYVYVGLLGNLLRWLTSFFQDSLLHGCPYSSNRSPFVLVEPSTLYILPEMCLCSTFSMAL